MSPSHLRLMETQEPSPQLNSSRLHEFTFSGRTTVPFSSPPRHLRAGSKRRSYKTCPTRLHNFTN